MLSQEQKAFLIENYSQLGPKKIGELFNCPMKYISKIALSLGAHRGVAAGNIARKRPWDFTGWSYDLGYICGVYLGDGNCFRSHGHGDYFRLSVIDYDFCLNTLIKFKTLTGKEGSIKQHKDKWTFTFCNTDFVDWLVATFGLAKNKTILYLPSLTVNMGMLEGFIDSEGTITKCSIKLCMNGDLKPVESICQELLIKRRATHGGITNENWEGPNFKGYAIATKEYVRVGLGTYIKRKALYGIPYKGI
jgi:hypothetical protein